MVLLKKHLKVCLVYVSVIPVVNAHESLAEIKVLGRIDSLLNFLGHPVESDLLLKKFGKFYLDSLVEVFIFCDFINRSLSHHGAEILVITGH